MPDGDIVELAAGAPFIFFGSLSRTGASTVETVAASKTTAVVAVDTAARTPPGLTLRRGQEVTVLLLAPLRAGRYAFFAELLAAGDGLAVRERGHLDASSQAADTAVADALTQVYAATVGLRLVQASLVAHGTLGQVSALTEPTGQDDDTVLWGSAPLEIHRVLKGVTSLASATLIGPRKPARKYPRTPVLREGREAVYILQRPPQEALEAAGPALAQDALFAAETSDIRPMSELSQLEALLGSPGGAAR